MRRKAMSGTTIVVGILLVSLVVLCADRGREAKTLNTVIRAGMPSADAFDLLERWAAPWRIPDLLSARVEKLIKGLPGDASGDGPLGMREDTEAADPKQDAWHFLLPDGTVVTLLEGYAGAAHGRAVTGIVLGERGRSYGAIIPWARQKKTYPQRIDLNDFVSRSARKDRTLRVGMCLLEACYKLAQIAANEFSGAIAYTPGFACEPLWDGTTIDWAFWYDLPDGTILVVWAQCDLSKKERTFVVKRLTLGQRIPHPVGMDLIDEKTYTTPQEIDLNDFTK